MSNYKKMNLFLRISIIIENVNISETSSLYDKLKIKRNWFCIQLTFSYIQTRMLLRTKNI